MPTRIIQPTDRIHVPFGVSRVDLKLVEPDVPIGLWSYRANQPDEDIELHR